MGTLLRLFQPKIMRAALNWLLRVLLVFAIQFALQSFYPQYAQESLLIKFFPLWILIFYGFYAIAWVISTAAGLSDCKDESTSLAREVKQIKKELNNLGIE